MDDLKIVILTEKGGDIRCQHRPDIGDRLECFHAGLPDRLE
jgi:hypothetical protein